jgi:hypothetical protein
VQVCVIDAQRDLVVRRAGCDNPGGLLRGCGVDGQVYGCGRGLAPAASVRPVPVGGLDKQDGAWLAT